MDKNFKYTVHDLNVKTPNLSYVQFSTNNSLQEVFGHFSIIYFITGASDIESNIIDSICAIRCGVLS